MQTYIEILKNGGIGIIATDTLYGIVGSALNQETVERIYKIKGRDSNKPFIILISALSDLRLFGIKVNSNLSQTLKKYWPGKYSIILSCQLKKFEYLHRGSKSLAFRLPKSKRLISLLKKTGPLVAPSANPQGEAPAKSLKDAKKYFGNLVDFYDNTEKPKTSKPSTLLRVENNRVTVLRP